ncbi:unnamed protein product [Heterotrigona itama]|uniref:Chemosensory protein n=1 Tax=Heterotrigona itama TaxID=395501 RepID=A0A6V7GT89_9HYME|nr:unnamed protein product [Heterotrigona itama]
MKVQILLLFTIFILTSFTEAHRDTTSNFLMDRSYVLKQIDCVLKIKECDAIGKKIIALLPEAVNNHCRKCTSRQAALANKLMIFMEQNYPNQWRLILQYYKTTK